MALGIRASRTSIRTSADVRVSERVRSAFAMWPGYQLTVGALYPDRLSSRYVLDSVYVLASVMEDGCDCDCLARLSVVPAVVFAVVETMMRRTSMEEGVKDWMLVRSSWNMMVVVVTDGCILILID